MKVKRFCDIVKENDNLNKSYQTMNKFGLGYDPNKEFRPDFLVKTRYEIAQEMLVSYYKSEGEEFEDLDEDVQAKMCDDFNQLLSDSDCQKYVETLATVFLNGVEDGYIAEAETELAREMILNKKFDTEKYEN